MQLYLETQVCYASIHLGPGCIDCGSPAQYSSLNGDHEDDTALVSTCRQVEEVSLTKHGSEDQRQLRIEELRHARSGPGKAAKVECNCANMGALATLCRWCSSALGFKRHHAYCAILVPSQNKTEERKAAALQARVAGMKKRVSTAVPRISRVFSPSSSRPSGEDSSTAAAADTEEI